MLCWAFGLLKTGDRSAKLNSHQIFRSYGTWNATFFSHVLFWERVVYNLTRVRKKACMQLCKVLVQPTYVHTRSQMLRARSHSQMSQTLCELFANFFCTVPYDCEMLVTWEMVESKVEKWFWIHYQFTNDVYRRVFVGFSLVSIPIQTPGGLLLSKHYTHWVRGKCIIVYAKQPLGFNKPLSIVKSFPLFDMPIVITQCSGFQT